MEDSQNRRLEMFTRVKNFGAAHATDFDAHGLGSQLFTSLGELVDRLDTHASTKVSSSGKAKEGTSTRAVAREALREDMEAINRTAHAMSEDIPGLDDKFRLPRSSNDQNLLSAARAFAADATPLAAEFIKREMPADFIADLNADIAALEEAINHQTSGVGSRISAGVAIDETIDQGLVIVRKLNAIVRNRYTNDPATLAEWTSGSHTERGPKRKTVAPPPPPPPPTPAPSAP